MDALQFSWLSLCSPNPLLEVDKTVEYSSLLTDFKTILQTYDQLRKSLIVGWSTKTALFVCHCGTIHKRTFTKTRLKERKTQLGCNPRGWEGDERK